jgi:hypothetical protein
VFRVRDKLNIYYYSDEIHQRVNCKIMCKMPLSVVSETVSFFNDLDNINMARHLTKMRRNSENTGGQ